MAIYTHDGYHGQESGKPGIDPRLLEFFKELQTRNKELFKKLFPKFHREDFAEFADHFQAICSEAKKRGAGQARRSDDTVLQRSLSVNSPRIASRGIGGDEEPLKLERFKVRMVDIDGDAGGSNPPGSGGGAGGSGQSGPKPGGSKSK
ncbi:hypothetical protein CDL15_Pgr022750 [Punica granatum]|uniref:Uncharacterized protein n=1 Tax=Punica granatum TaxID=22663 RepID=A0A218XRK1_PUNGR|nr:hypothetical protein CDL15_Pgr022750 [Punica granatum]PKI63700.1 hypothetical protein CRG98_015890 [Punica granatum]